jgi:6-pyruvoyltetrahydropterin/6-carboxytetrahydropterin synthase
VKIFNEFTFEAAHLLPNVPEGHKCRRLHGHSFRVMVSVSGPVDDETGWVMDFADIEAACDPVRDRLKPSLPDLVRVKLWETCTAGCVYKGEDG